MYSLRFEGLRRKDSFLKTDNSIMLSMSDVFFWCGVLCELVVSFSGYLFGGYHEQLIALIGMGFFAGKILLSMDVKKDWMISLVAVLFGLICYKVQNTAIVMRMVLILLAGKDQDVKKVIRLFFYGTVAVMIFGVILAVAGKHNAIYVEDVFRHGDIERRYEFGFFHPNAFAFFWFRIVVMGLYLYGDKLKLLGSIIVVILAVIPAKLCNSKIAMAIVIFSGILFIMLQIFKAKWFYRFYYILGNVFIFLNIALAYGGMILYEFHATADGELPVGLWSSLDYYLFTGRIEHSHDLFETVTITLFGHNKYLMTVEVGYVSALFSQGIVFSVIFVIMIFSLYRKLYKDKQYKLMAIVLCTCTYCLAESFVPYVNKNLILMVGIGYLLNFSIYFDGSKLKKSEDLKTDKKTIKINFVDFWNDLDKENNYFVNILKKHYNVVISENPDYCFCSCFGNEHLKYPRAIKIFFTGENIVPDFNEYDYALGFSYLDFSDRYLRLPLYVLYDKAVMRALKKHENTDEYFLKKKKGIGMVISNPDADPLRGMIIDALFEKTDVYSGGRYRNNVGGPVKDKYAFLKDYRLSLAFENSGTDGYTTEKILEAFAAETIPVYWGSESITREFNPKSFVNVRDFDSAEKAADYIVELIQDDKKYLDIIKQPAVVEGCEADKYFKDDYAEAFLLGIFDQDIENAYRRNMLYAGKKYQIRRLYAYQLMRILDLINKPVHWMNKKITQIFK